MLSALILFAQDEAKKGQPEGIGGFLGSNGIILLPILFMLFYFVVILPQQRKQRKEQESLMSGMKKNDEVVTAAGIIGVIANIKEGGDEVVLKIDDNARMRVLKSSIVRIVKKEEPKEGSTPAAGAPPANTNVKPAS
ncbi:MAG: preprotein translocase subunit YajC [Planctomycetes bacterium]|nr:preprotein translocase subunit YajC [Planctomycetota bacterium]